MKDYIDNYRDAVNQTKEGEEVDSAASKSFYYNARRDVSSAKAKGLMQEMSYEDYLDAAYKGQVRIDDELRRIILFKPYFSATLISKQYKMHVSTVVRFRNKHEEEELDSI